MSIEAMKQALDALEHHGGHLPWNSFVEVRKDLRAAIQQAESDHARLPGVLKDHQIAAMVNSLRDIARQFHGHDSLRERIANVLVPALKAEAKTDEPVAYMWQHDETGRTGFVEAGQLAMGWRDVNPRLKIVAPCYTHPAPSVPMTDEQISLEAHNADDRDWNDLRFRSSWHEGFLEGARFAEARHGIAAQAKKEIE